LVAGHREKQKTFKNCDIHWPYTSPYFLNVTSSKAFPGIVTSLGPTFCLKRVPSAIAFFLLPGFKKSPKIETVNTRSYLDNSIFSINLFIHNSQLQFVISLLTMIVELPTRHGLWVHNATKIQMKDYSHIMSFTPQSNQNLQLKSQKENLN
jgi:hypothetical protein